MRISDWSSDVCSSDLALAPEPRLPLGAAVTTIAQREEERLQVGGVAVGQLAERRLGGKAIALLFGWRLGGGQLVGLARQTLQHVGAHGERAAVPARDAAVADGVADVLGPPRPVVSSAERRVGKAGCS